MNIIRCLCAAIVVSVFVVPYAHAANDKPNLLIIQTDEHNFRTLGCYRATMRKDQALMWGDAVVETPHIDSIAKRGVLCTRFYATSPVCSPSRASLVSGRYPHRAGVPGNNAVMLDNVITFAEVLKRRGYATGYAGKWHLDGNAKPGWAPKRKFGFDDNRYMFNRGHWKKLEITPDGPRVGAREKNKPSYNVDGADEKTFATDWLTDRTIDFIAEHKGEPFCYYVSIPDPHGPDTVRKPYDTMYAEQEYTKPRTFDKPETATPEWAKPQGNFADMARYYGMVKCIDDNVGRILAALDKHGLTDNTIVVFTSDHGDLRGEHHRQNKGVPYEGSARIPFIVAAPGIVKSHSVVREALGTVDFKPTILSLMGAKMPDKTDGRDASKLLATGEAPSGWDDVTFVRAAGHNVGLMTWLSAVTKDHKLVVGASGQPWLFDRNADPDELVNVADSPKHRKVAARLGQQIVDYIKRTGDPYGKHPRLRANLQRVIDGG